MQIQHRSGSRLGIWAMVYEEAVIPSLTRLSLVEQDTLLVFDVSPQQRPPLSGNQLGPTHSPLAWVELTRPVVPDQKRERCWVLEGVKATQKSCTPVSPCG